MLLLLYWGFIKLIKKILLLIIFNCLIAQVITNNSFNNSKSIALAGSTVSSPGGVENIINNPANVSFNAKTSLIMGSTVFYETDFLGYEYCSLLYKPNQNTNLSLTIQQLGTNAKNTPNLSLLSERALTLSHGFTLLKDRNSSLRLGYNLSYFLLEQGRSSGVTGDGSDGLSKRDESTIGLDFGIWGSLREKVFLGAFIKNINSPSIGSGSYSNFLPRKINIGFSYLPIKKLITSFSYERLLGSKINHFRFGIEFEMHKYFTLRAGIQMKPNRFGLGFIVPINDYASFIYSLVTHPVLSLSHNVEVGFKF